MKTDTEALADAARLLRAAVGAGDYPVPGLAEELDAAADSLDACAQTTPLDHPARLAAVSTARALLGEVA